MSPLDALARWPREVHGPLEPLGNAGGFSGARLWRVGGAFCLRAAPASLGDVPRIHGWMREARDAGLAFVPAVIPTTDGVTAVAAGGVVWELQSWMPGVADYRAAPSRSRLEAACNALARLHLVWRRYPTTGHAPAVLRRLAALGCGVLHRRLSAHADATFPLFPCLVDVWHDHVLFTADGVTGVVDYAAMRPDVPHADLARLLGDLVGDDDAGWAAGLAAYGRLLPVPDERLTRLLDRAGALAAWRTWEQREARGQVVSDGARRRLTQLRARVAAWDPAERLTG